MHILGYDHLIIALGGETNFFGIPGVREELFTMKDIDDAIILRNHILNSLEQANLEKANVELDHAATNLCYLRSSFNSVETVGVLNDFVRGIIKKYYHDINMAHVRVILLMQRIRYSPKSMKLGHRALEKLKQRGVGFIMAPQVTGVTASSATLDNGSTIEFIYRIVWSAGVSSTN